MNAAARRRQSLRCCDCGEVIGDPALSGEWCGKCFAYRENHAAVKKFLREVPPPKRDLLDRVKRLENQVSVLVETADE